MTTLRFLHLAGILFFVGGQLMLVVAVAPALRQAGDDATMRVIARRFAVGSAIALVVIIASGVALAAEYGVWDEPLLQGKLMLLVLVFVLVGLHVMSTHTRVVSVGLAVTSLLIVYLGIRLTYG